ncbi:unnamed protein product [Amoebophrya sp. A120]|nr:unnamed protein product [Amoebophrya sp. A120]|eukprot:GSA120T00007217001.1
MSSASSSSKSRPPVVRDAHSGQEFDRNSVSTADGSLLECVGAGCRFKKIGFIELKIYAFACYVRKSDLDYNKGPLAVAAATSSSGATGSTSTWGARFCDAIGKPAPNGMSVQCELLFLKPITSGMMSSSLKDDLGPLVGDEEEIKKVESLAPTDGISTGTRLTLRLKNGDTIEPSKDNKPMPSVTSRKLVKALCQLWFIEKTSVVRGFPAMLEAEMGKIAKGFATASVGGGTTAGTASAVSTTSSTSRKNSSTVSVLVPTAPASGTSAKILPSSASKPNSSTSSASSSSLPSTAVPSPTESTSSSSSSTSHRSAAGASKTNHKNPSPRTSTSSSNRRRQSTTIRRESDFINKNNANKNGAGASTSTLTTPTSQWINLKTLQWDHIKDLSQVKISGELFKWHLDGSALRGKLMRAWSPRFFSLERGLLTYRKRGKMTEPLSLLKISVVIEANETEEENNGAKTLTDSISVRGGGGEVEQKRRKSTNSLRGDGEVEAGGATLGENWFSFWLIDRETDEPMFRLASKDHQNATQWITQIVASIFFLRRDAQRASQLRLSHFARLEQRRNFYNLQGAAREQHSGLLVEQQQQVQNATSRQAQISSARGGGGQHHLQEDTSEYENDPRHMIKYMEERARQASASRQNEQTLQNNHNQAQQEAHSMQSSPATPSQSSSPLDTEDGKVVAAPPSSSRCRKRGTEVIMPAQEHQVGSSAQRRPRISSSNSSTLSSSSKNFGSRGRISSSEDDEEVENPNLYGGGMKHGLYLHPRGDRSNRAGGGARSSVNQSNYKASTTSTRAAGATTATNFWFVISMVLLTVIVLQSGFGVDVVEYGKRNLFQYFFAEKYNFSYNGDGPASGPGAATPPENGAGSSVPVAAGVPIVGERTTNSVRNVTK